MAVQFLNMYLQVLGVVVVGGSIGWWLDRKETLRMTRFRDKSALYGKVLKPGEAPSWP